MTNEPTLPDLRLGGRCRMTNLLTADEFAADWARGGGARWIADQGGWDAVTAPAAALFRFMEGRPGWTFDWGGSAYEATWELSKDRCLVAIAESGILDEGPYDCPKCGELGEPYLLASEDNVIWEELVGHPDAITDDGDDDPDAPCSNTWSVPGPPYELEWPPALSVSVSIGEAEPYSVYSSIGEWYHFEECNGLDSLRDAVTLVEENPLAFVPLDEEAT